MRKLKTENMPNLALRGDEKSPTCQIPEVKKGDIFYASWGWEQTNIDFCIVEEVSPTGKTVKCRMMGEKEIYKEGMHPMSEYVIPSRPDPNGELFRLHVRTRSTGEPCLVGKYPYVQGDTRRDYFWKWDGHPLYQSHYA